MDGQDYMACWVRSGVLQVPTNRPLCCSSTVCLVVGLSMWRWWIYMVVAAMCIVCGLGSVLSLTHTHTRTHAHKHTHAHTNAHASTHTCTHTDKCIHKHIYALTQQHTHTLCDVLSVLVTGCGTLRNIPAALNTQPAGRTHHWWLDTQTHAHTHI